MCSGQGRMKEEDFRKLRIVRLEAESRFIFHVMF